VIALPRRLGRLHDAGSAQQVERIVFVVVRHACRVRASSRKFSSASRDGVDPWNASPVAAIQAGVLTGEVGISSWWNVTPLTLGVET